MIPPELRTPAQLIQAAFEQARKSGKTDWQQMTIAVLKNRMLVLTGGQFKETNFGVRTIREFVELANDLVSLDTTDSLPLVVLLGETPQRVQHETSQRIRVRADLWRAIIDYSSGSPFVWDSVSNQARPRLPDDEFSILPTISAEELRAWRRLFVDQHSANLEAAAIEQLNDWQERILSSKTLPSQLASSWLKELSDRVLTRLRLWFTDRGIKEPPDLFLVFDTTKTEASSNTDLKAIRRLAIDCVKVMTARELFELRFSPEIYLRAMQEHKRRAD